MENKFNVTIMDDVLEFIGTLLIKQQNKILGAINILGNKKFDEIYVKHLSDKIKELKVGKYRLIFFIHKDEAVFVSAFIKKSNKTPKLEIELALKFYQSFIKFNQNKNI